jgi:uncharacterized membrane protein YeaQ/YmgE (transglycosylase-associated protein family)
VHFSGGNIVVILLAGIIVGLLPSTVVQRRGARLVSDLTIGVLTVFIGNYLVFAWRDWLPGKNGLRSSKPAETLNYEPVVFPLAPLRTLLKPIIPRSREEICGSLVEAARRNDLPTPFFIRLLYQESGFRPEAISMSGAMGMAQFMPETATDRNVDNPFDPLQAIPASARLLRDLQKKFGNLGLATAAYNAGPKRVQDWITNKGQLPQETQNYVRSITGWAVESWTGVQAGSPALKLPQGAPCQEMAGLLAWSGPDQIPLPQPNPRTQNVSNPVPLVQQSPDDKKKEVSDDAQAKR